MFRPDSRLARTLRRLFRGKSWKRRLATLLSAWNRHVIARLAVVIVVIWLAGATLLHLFERGQNPGFDTWGESLWAVWITMFSGNGPSPVTIPGRVLLMLLLVTGVALAGLFTASVASVLVERYLRRREVPTFEMEDHLVLCNWAPRGLEWIREVHSNIVTQKRPVVIIHDAPEEVELPDQQDDPAFADVYIIKGDPVNEIVLRRAKVPQAHSVVVLSDERLGEHADGKSILVCIAVRGVCRSGQTPNVAAECKNPRFRHHMRKAGADEVISSSELGLRMLARAALFHGMTRVYHELLTVGRDANELYLVPVPEGLVGKTFVDVAGRFLRRRGDKKSCLLIGVQRGEAMMLNPVGGEAGPLREGDELILLSQVYPDPSQPLPLAAEADEAEKKA